MKTQNPLRVIDDNLIKKAIDKQNEKKGKQSDKDFKEIEQLIFSYQRIYKIQGLRGLHNLQVLKLDNNSIKKIENLDDLKNLRSLDLSFNQIETVENLDMLTKLEDLSLYHNQIVEIKYEKIKNLKNLNLLSLKHNKISDLNGLIRSLKLFRNLQVLTIQENPLTDDTEYKNYIYSNLSNLKYLDYQYIDDNERSKAEDFKYKLSSINDKNAQENFSNNKNGGKLIENIAMEKLISYNLINYDKYLLNSNPELKQLLSLPNVFEESTQKLNENIKNLIDNIRSKIIDDMYKKDNLINQFEKAYDHIVNSNEQESLERLRLYYNDKKNLVNYLDETKENNKVERIENTKEQLIEVDEFLIQKEMILKNRLRSSFQILETHLKTTYKTLESNIVGEHGIKIVETFLQEFFQKFSEEALQEQSRWEVQRESESQENIIEDGEEEDQMQIDIKETFMDTPEDLKNIIATIKDQVENKHRNTESYIQKDIEKEMTDYLNKKRTEIKILNRQNTFNIIEMVKEENNFWTKKLSEYEKLQNQIN